MLVTLHHRQFEVAEALNAPYWKGVSSGSWEPQTFRIFERFIDREHSYIDMGAYLGVTLLFGCQLARRAFGIEPDPMAFAELDRNVENNRPITDNVQLVQACIAPRSGTAMLGNCGSGGDSVSSLLFGNRRTHWTVKALSFEDFIRAYDIRDCNFIKIDIEGGEYALLPSMRGFLAAHRPTLHLSLHPCHLGKRGIGWIGKLFTRAFATLRVLPCLKMYRHLYDHDGQPLTGAQLLWRSLAKVTFDVVATDREWSMPRTG